MTTETRFAILPTWSLIADNTEAFAVPGGVLVRSFTQSQHGDPPTTAPAFVPGAALEPEVMTDGGTSYARLVAAPPPAISVHGDVFGTPTPEFVDALRRATDLQDEIRRARRARPHAELHITPERGRAGAVADFELHGHAAAHLAVGDYFTLGGNLFRVDPMNDGTPMINLLGAAPAHAVTSTTEPRT